MHIGQIIQFATLLSLLMGGLGLVVRCDSREQVKTQIFLAMSAQYDELLKNCSAEFWLNAPLSMELPERRDELTISMLRFCTLFINLSSISRTPHTKTDVGADAALRRAEVSESLICA